MNDIILWDSSGWNVRGYYLIVLGFLLYYLFRYRKQKLSIYILLLFFNGMFSFYGKNLQNVYRIVLVMLTIYWIIRTNGVKNFNKFSIIGCFIFFSITFLYATITNGDYFFIVFSQYSRYFILFSLFFILRRLFGDQQFRVWIEKLIYEILILQIILSIIKFIIIGTAESIVGTVASQGGAVATTLPMMGFMFLWLKKRGKFERNDWFIIFGLAFIGFVSLKRAIWFIMPILIILLMFFVQKKKIPLKVSIYALLAVPLVFYFGVRFNPSLNKEGHFGGSFDMGYAVDYAQKYMFGEKDINQPGQGRGGATLLLYDKFVNGDLRAQDWLGYGLRFMYTTDYEAFDELGFGISGKGAATGVFQTMVTSGYLGIIATILFVFSLLYQTKNQRLRIVLIGVFCWEYFFYTGILIRELSLSFLLIYVILYSNVIEIDKEREHNIKIVYET
jgi:hypothetical protein